MLIALCSANTIPVKIAAVAATASDRTPMISISAMTSRKYFRGRTTLRATCPVSNPTPPYHITARVSAVSIPYSLAKLSTKRWKSSCRAANAAAGAM